jgi:HlyD family secretion protein
MGHQMRGIFGWIKRHPIWSVIFVLIAGLIIWSSVKPRVPEYEYITEKVERGEVIRKVSASGKLRALNTIKVGSEVSGQVTRVLVDYNSPVTKGQVLAVIDPTRVQAAVGQSQAQVSLAQATLAQAQSNVVRSQADIELQERDFGRKKALADRGFLSKAALDTSAGQLNESRNALRVASAQVASARAQITQATAQLSSSQLDLSRTTIVAPTSGVIINKLVEPGTTVAASFQTPNLFEIAADITQMQVEASVDEADIGQVKEGQSVTFTVDSYPDDVFEAKVRQVRQAPVEAQNVVSYLVIIDVSNLEGKLLPGMTANVDILTSSKPNVTRIPTAALRFKPRAADMVDETKKTPDAKKPAEGKKDASDKGKDKQNHTVYIATADPYKPKVRRVTIGAQGDDFTEIIAGLNPGETILLRSKSLKPKPDESVSDKVEDADDDAAS